MENDHDINEKSLKGTMVWRDTSKEKQQKTKTGSAILYVTFRKKASLHKIRIPIKDGDYKIKHIKCLIWRNMEVS